MLPEYFESLIDELQLATSKSKHDFKYPVLTTVDKNGIPRSRTVVLREIDVEKKELIVFTDSRSIKVEHIKSNDQACFLFYNSKKLLQLRCNGRLIEINSPKEVKRLFQKVTSKSIKDYTSIPSPGTPIDNPDHVEYVSRDKSFFLPLRFEISEIEYLKLKRPNHLRALYKREDNWAGHWLAP
ncbi:pyridoxamine 5'-phosphate oxidase family protein [Nonlabens tegetincola]|uniref:pyridoxamine 5'-phosphate oxidase family protein n=1 Tax=Nonlabens tegetincola TaxID=323273 RepID=UPI0030C86D48